VGKSKDLYGLLRLPRGALREDIRKAHRELVREYHPDVNPGDDSAEELFKEVQRAYEVLSSPHKRREYDEGLLCASDLERKLVGQLIELCNDRQVFSWKACVSVLALFLIVDGFLFYRYERPENSLPEPPTTASVSQRLPSPSSADVAILAEPQAEENDTHPDAIDHEQQDSYSSLRGTEPVATEDLSPSLLSSTASANHLAPGIAEEGLTILLPTNVTAADYYSPDSLYEDDGYYLPDPLYEDDGYYLPDPLYEQEVDYE
jgi:curved DNA-binding protein CbpA